MSDEPNIAENSDNESDSYRSIHTEESWHCGCCYDPYPIDILMDRHHNFINEYETRKGRGAISHTCIKKGDKRSERKVKKTKDKPNKIEMVRAESDAYSDTDTDSEMTLPRGDFSFIADISIRVMFDDAYKAITKADAWNFVSADPGEGGFMYSSDPMSAAITKEMTYDGHSGASYGWTMRKMQRLARIGWDAFVAENRNITL
jgi:hypothetical protein